MGETPDQLWQFDELDDPSFRRLRRVMKYLPSNPRCKLCEAPFGGLGGKILSLTSFGPSRKNPNLCNTCFEGAPAGGVEGMIGVLFADVRGFTAIAETMAPSEAAELLNRFYAVATEAMLARDAIVDKLVGDEVMALFIPPLPGEGMLSKMVDAAADLLHGVDFGSDGGPWLDVGVGLAYGHAFVGNVGSGAVKDFTAVGDVVNTAARLQAQADAGSIVMSEAVFRSVADRYPDAEPLDLELKGKSAPVRAYAVALGAPAVAG